MAVINCSEKYPFSPFGIKILYFADRVTAKIEYFLNYGDRIG